MLRHLHLIPLRIVAYSDRSSILAAYTRELGRASFLVPAGASREARRRRALLMPMCPVECVGDIVQGREVYAMRDVQPSPPLPLISSDPVRASVAMFLSELMAAVLRQSESEPLLFDFVASAACRLGDADVAPGNFHIMFLCRLLGFLGLEPDVADYAPGMLFDLRDGVFRSAAPLHPDFLSADESAAVASLGRMTWDNMHLYKYTRAQRARVLDVLLDYISAHHVSLAGVRSLAVVRSLFD